MLIKVTVYVVCICDVSVLLDHTHHMVKRIDAFSPLEGAIYIDQCCICGGCRNYFVRVEIVFNLLKAHFSF